MIANIDNNLYFRLVSEKTVEENILKKANQKRLLGDLAIEGGNFTTAYFKSVSTSIKICVARIILFLRIINEKTFQFQYFQKKTRNNFLRQFIFIYYKSLKLF